MAQAELRHHIAFTMACEPTTCAEAGPGNGFGLERVGIVVGILDAVERGLVGGEHERNKATTGRRAAYTKPGVLVLGAPNRAVALQRRRLGRLHRQVGANSDRRSFSGRHQRPQSQLHLATQGLNPPQFVQQGQHLDA
jgi:hypothetical protein